jgi:hypothetical protein
MTKNVKLKRIVQDPDGMGDPDRGAKGNHVGGGLQAELEW